MCTLTRVDLAILVDFYLDQQFRGAKSDVFVKQKLKVAERLLVWGNG